MTTTTISIDAPLVTLINIFTVDADRQQELIDALDQATRELFAGIDGFQSANLHAGLDGTHVANYAQWASEEKYEAMKQLPAAQQHMAEIMKIATKVEPRLFAVRAIHHAG